MKKQVYYNSLDEKEKIIDENSNLYIIEIYETLNENYLVLSSSPAEYKELSYEELENELLIITNELQGGLL
ncbi:hypothetical protein IC213_17645 [Clostridioides sp. ES-S-0049-02]|uniref:hypothetical protein n=1 Tax=Clostridioides sp. ES-S-0049-02 TaxID=2770778 RepID=UPI001D126CA3|nr:hypothetical protein [Clostridioides sp. ES-S-0049-02]